MAHYISYRVIDQALISDKCFRSIGSYIHIPFTACCVVYRTAKHTPDILNIALQHKRSRELSVRDDLLPILFLVLSSQLKCNMQMLKLLFKHKLPYATYSCIRLRFITAPIQPALDILMHKEIFKAAHAWLQQTAILCDMLFLDHSDFLI